MYLNKMSSILTNLSVIQKLSRELVQAKHLNYSQQCIPYYVDESNFIIENVQDLKNLSGYLLKSTLIRHRVKEDDRKQHNRSASKQFINYTSSVSAQYSNANSKCVVYLHGLGSSRLQALPIVQCLPKDYCLFAFDFAGSGKSQGQNITYGLRQSQDVGTIIDYLKVNKGIRQFVVWGRSMGGVAALLYSISLAQNSKQSITSKAQLSRIKGLVVDSPFSDFRQITKQIGLKRIKIPEFLLNFALNFIQSSFNQLLKDSKRGDKIYNPFQIKLGEQSIQTKIPTVFLYSLVDQVVPKEHSQKIIKVYRSAFEKIVMQECTHNQSRPKQSIKKVFQSLNKFQSKLNSHLMNKEGGINGAHFLSRNKSLDINESRGSRGRRGISVESREKQKSSAFNSTNYMVQNQDQIKNSKISIQSYSSLKIQPKKQKLSLKMCKNVYINDSTNNINHIEIIQHKTDYVEQMRQKTGSPLKIRLSNSVNKNEGKISVSGMKKTQKPKIVNMIGSSNHFYNTIQYDNSILQRKLQKQKSVQDVNIVKNIENKNNYKYRRNSQLNRKVEYQLSHTRYL